MAQETNLKPTVVDKIIEVLKEGFPKGMFRAYFYGDPVAIGQSLLPCVIVDETATDYKFGPTGFDEVTHTIQIQLVYNKKDDFGKKTTEVALSRKLHNVAQGRDATTGEFIPETLLGILRKNITLENTSINQIGKIEFGIVPRPEDMLTVEAQLTLTVTNIQEISGRT